MQFLSGCSSTLGVAISECEAQLRLEAKIDAMMRPENLKEECY